MSRRSVFVCSVDWFVSSCDIIVSEWNLSLLCQNVIFQEFVAENNFIKQCQTDNDCLKSCKRCKEDTDWIPSRSGYTLLKGCLSEITLATNKLLRLYCCPLIGKSCNHNDNEDAYWHM